LLFSLSNYKPISQRHCPALFYPLFVSILARKENVDKPQLFFLLTSTR